MTQAQWKLIRHFRPSEFEDPTHPGPAAEMMKWEIVSRVDQIRTKIGLPLIVASGYRTKEHNAEVGGVDSSAHEEGWAVDIVVRESPKRLRIIETALALGIDRIGVAKTFVHLDCDPSKPAPVMWLYA